MFLFSMARRRQVPIDVRTERTGASGCAASSRMQRLVECRGWLTRCPLQTGRSAFLLKGCNWSPEHVEDWDSLRLLFEAKHFSGDTQFAALLH